MSHQNRMPVSMVTYRVGDMKVVKPKDEWRERTVYENTVCLLTKNRRKDSFQKYFVHVQDEREERTVFPKNRMRILDEQSQKRVSENTPDEKGGI